MTSKTISDEEEARIQSMIASDMDAPEATDEQLFQAKPFAVAFPDLSETPTFSRYDTADYLKTEEDIALYLEAAAEDGDPKRIAEAMAIAERARNRIARRHHDVGGAG